MFKKNPIKLKYESININNIQIFFAKSKTKNMRISIKSHKYVYLVVPYFVTNAEMLNFVNAKTDWIKKNLIQFGYMQNNSEMIIINTKEKIGIAKKRDLIKKINEYIKKYEVLMNKNVLEIKLRKMKRAWGICDKTNKIIKFNIYLIYMPDEFIESVVAHEMSHLFVANHSKNFYDVLLKYYPNYKKIWNKYKKNVVFD